MRKLTYLRFWLLPCLFILSGIISSCSRNLDEPTVIKVDFPAENAESISWLDVFTDIEFIALSGENKPMFHLASNLIVTDNAYYIVDMHATCQVQRFDKEGKFLNSIGNFGRGPEEYLDMTDVMIDDSGNLCIYSQFSEAVFTYSPDGTLLNKRQLPYATERFFSYGDFDYYYIGTAGWHYKGSSANPKEYKLYVTAAGEKELVAQHLRANSYSAPNRHTFTLVEDNLYMCPNEGGEVYVMEDSKIECKYNFDFGEYAIPEELYEILDMKELIASIREMTVANKLDFWENDDFSLLEGSIQSKVVDFRGFCGIAGKNKREWKWFNQEFMDFVFFRYLDDKYAYFIADPADMKENPELVERFPELLSLDTESGMVLLRAKTSGINLE